MRVQPSPGIHRDAVHQFLIEPQQPAPRTPRGAEICNLKSDATMAAMRDTSAGDACRSMMSSNTSGG
jgi:hypothetical protein